MRQKKRQGAMTRADQMLLGICFFSLLLIHVHR